ncbi:DNA polymerase interacting tpr containing protein of 47kD [Anticarsia gemmatalis]|uniref:DNA polymerase interacting tpr containing protein of 47kD n=1 Tax=Anticarsia gemmatalis TaxID=129554 RepID=UPI003F76F7D1
MAEEAPKAAKQPMTEEERVALCQKLDEELEDFIDSLEKKKYSEGWPEDRWEEEMDKHPFFMKSTPEGGDEMSPLAEGLAKLKYDPEENTPVELATNYKEDGNFNFKHKNYRLAILGYTEGIKQKCDNAEINASLYNNRAASQWFLKNYRSALHDSEKALSFNPNHTKARLRAAKAAFEITKYDTCIEHCEKILEADQKDTEAAELLKSAKQKKQLKERDERKKQRDIAKAIEQRELVLTAIKERGIRVMGVEDDDELLLGNLEPCLPGTQDAIVHMEDGVLKFPVLILYPEYQMTDFIRNCPENVTLMKQLEQLFPAPWDEERKYNCDTIVVYYEGFDRMPHRSDPNMTLGELIVAKYYLLKAGTPAFYIVPRDSDAELKFLEGYV